MYWIYRSGICILNFKFSMYIYLRRDCRGGDVCVRILPPYSSSVDSSGIDELYPDVAVSILSDVILPVLVAVC